MDYLVGTGGWGYFQVGNKSSLAEYSRIFDFVEVNYTFYKYPKTTPVKAWRQTVPQDFMFSVRCHQDLTHKIGLKPVDQAYEIFSQMHTYCDVLKTPYLILETPATYTINQETVSQVSDFLTSIDLKGIQLVWEYRAPITEGVLSLMQDFNIIQCIDLSKEKPAFNSDVSYSRLFGRGQHNLYQFTDCELLEIDRKAQETHSKTSILSYHGARMYSDEARFSQYKKTGGFLPVTSYMGVDSAKAVLVEDTRFPITKSELEVEQGWKVFDLTQTHRMHLFEVLNKIPNKTYSSLDEVIEELMVVL